MLIVQFMASDKWGGAEKVFVEISNELSLRHEVVAILLRDTEYRDRFSERVRIIELLSNATSHNPFLVWELGSVLRKIGPDVVHTHAAKAAALLKKVSYFVRVRHLATKHNARKGRVFNSLRWITAVSEQAGKSIRPRRKSEIRVINNGLVPITLPRSKRTGDFSMVAIGRLDKIKGFDILLEQVSRLSFPYHLGIVGEGPEYDHLKRKIQQLGLEGRVVLEGFRDDIPQRMRDADLVVIASVSEGFPKVMVEALFYANVLVSTPVGGVVEVLPEEFLAAQTELAEKIAAVKREYPRYFSEFAALRKNRSEDFFLPKIIGSYEEVYREMVRDERHSCM